MLPGRRVDAGDPKAAELPLAGLAVPEGVISRPFGGFPNRAVLAAFGAKITFGQFKNFFLRFLFATARLMRAMFYSRSYIPSILLTASS